MLGVDDSSQLSAELRSGRARWAAAGFVMTGDPHLAPRSERFGISGCFSWLLACVAMCGLGFAPWCIEGCDGIGLESSARIPLRPRNATRDPVRTHGDAAEHAQSSVSVNSGNSGPAPPRKTRNHSTVRHARCRVPRGVGSSGRRRPGRPGPGLSRAAGRVCRRPPGCGRCGSRNCGSM